MHVCAPQVRAQRARTFLVRTLRKPSFFPFLDTEIQLFGGRQATEFINAKKRKKNFFEIFSKIFRKKVTVIFL